MGHADRHSLEPRSTLVPRSLPDVYYRESAFSPAVDHSTARVVRKIERRVARREKRIAATVPDSKSRESKPRSRTRSELAEMWTRAIAVTAGQLSRRTFAGGGLPPRRLLVYERDGWHCVECGATRNLTLDHVIPKSRGGDGSIGNLQTMCSRCNNRKGAKMPTLAKRLAA